MVGWCSMGTFNDPWWMFMVTWDNELVHGGHKPTYNLGGTSLYGKWWNMTFQNIGEEPRKMMSDQFFDQYSLKMFDAFSQGSYRMLFLPWCFKTAYINRRQKIPRISTPKDHWSTNGCVSKSWELLGFPDGIVSSLWPGATSRNSGG